MFKQKLTWLTDKTYNELFQPLSILWFKKLRDKIVYHKNLMNSDKFHPLIT